MQIPIEKAIELALEQHRQGHFQRAQQMYIGILQQDPGNVDAIHLLGVLAHQGKRSDMAVELIGRAIGQRPDVPVFHYNFADALAALGRFREAADSYRKAVELQPEYPEAWNNLAFTLIQAGEFLPAIEAAHRAVDLSADPSIALNNLGNALRGAGRFDDAMHAFERAVEANPQYAEAHNNLGLAHAHKLDLARARTCYERAIALKPNFADAYNNLGVTHLRQAEREEAARCFQTAISVQPIFPQALNNLGVALRESGRPEESLTYYRKALDQKPDFAEACNNLATALRDLHRVEEALETARKAISLNPLLPESHFTLGSLLHLSSQLDPAIDAIRECIRLAPSFAQAHSTLGYYLIERGDVEEGMQALLKSIQIFPDPQTFSNTLLSVNYSHRYTPAEVFELHRDWGKRFEAIALPKVVAPRNDRDPDRRLRIGYISPDFRGHSVFFFAEPFLANHDKSRFEIFGYSNVIKPDPSTLRAQIYCDHWREIVGMKSEEILELIRADQIDILIDLAGHTGNSSLPVLIHRPAPIQIMGIGYPNTSGSVAIDYKITDEYCDPTGSSEAINAEKLLRLPRSFWCYRPPAEAGPVAPLPADQAGIVTFATVNNFAKVTPVVQETWARILAAAPNTRLILRSSGTGSEKARKTIIDRFASFGIAQDRLDLRGFCPFKQFLEGFAEIDIVLDPFPFNGGTTTCHNLWMGAPTVTLAGGNQCGRMGVSMLNNIGLPELIGRDLDDYVQIAARLASDLQRLRSIRASLRDRMSNSALRDEVGYTRELEAAYRNVWHAWCRS